MHTAPLFLLSLLACAVPGAGAATSDVSCEGDYDLPDFSAVGDLTGPGDEAAADESLILRFDGGRAPSNLLMISIDSFRLSFTDTFGDTPRGLTPNLDALMAESVVLRHHRSCSNWTYQSMTCGMTGNYTLSNGYVPISGEDEYVDLRALPSDAVLLPEILSDSGFVTGLLSTNSFFSDVYGFDRGFDLYNQLTMGIAGEVTDRGLEMAQTLDATGDRWYLHVHYVDPHASYDAPPAYLDDVPPPPSSDLDLSSGVGVYGADEAFADMSDEGQRRFQEYAEAMYGAELSYVDEHIGRLLGTLADLGTLDDTLVVIWSDHGEQLLKRGHLEHHELLHGEESDALALFWAPDIAPRQIELATSHTDLAPTTLAGLGVEAGWEVDGRVLRDTTPEGPVYSNVLQGPHTFQSVDYDGQRLIFGWEGSVELYDLEEDPAELFSDYDPDLESTRMIWGMLAPNVEAMDDYYEGFSPAYLP